MSEPPAKPKILMLHGYRQNESTFRERTGGLRKSLKSYFEFVYCQSPHVIPNPINETQVERGWWFSEINSSYNALEKTSCALGFDESLNYLNQVFRTCGPIDAILGFSQGACLAAMLCKISEEQNLQSRYPFIKFKYAFIVSGFRSGQTQHDIYFDSDHKIKTPSIHIFGETDQVIPLPMSISLSECFEQPVIYKHAAGHLVPVNSEAKKAILEFLNKQNN